MIQESRKPRTTFRTKASCLLAALLTWSSGLAGEVCATDDAGREICLDQPAERIIGLSPGATELLFAAGAAERVVAAVSHSDYPAGARELPRVGSYDRVDMEAVLARQPDLLIGWISGNPTPQLERLEQLGLPMFYIEPRSLEDVATTLEDLGMLSGTHAAARQRAQQLRGEVESLRRRYADAEPVEVFYQIWVDPLMTVNDEHVISETVRLCGGRNVFGDLPRLAPRISEEAVLAADPEAIIVGGMGEEDDSWLEKWRSYSGLRATRRDNLFFVPPSTLQRPTPRLVEGIRHICQHLETARLHR